MFGSNYHGSDRIAISIPNEDDLTRFRGHLVGTHGTPYEGGIFEV